MAETTDIEIINIETGDAIKSLNDLKGYIKDLKETLNEATIGSEEFTKAQDALDEAVIVQKNIMRGAANANKAAAGSYNDLTNQLATLRAAWKSTADEAERAQLAVKINEVKDKLTDMDASIKEYYRNVGNYAGSLAPLFQSLEGKINGVTQTLGAMGFSINGLVNPIKAVDAGFKMLNANPIMLGITVLIGAFLKIKDAIQGNEELQRRWNTAMAAFQPIINAAKNALDALAQGVVWCAEKISGFISIFSKASAETTKLAKAQDELNMKQREFKSNENALRAEAKQLKAQGKETQDLNEKLKLYNESREKLKQSNQQAVDLAAEELRLLEEQAKLAPNSAEDNEKIAAAKQKLGQAQEKLNQEDMEYIELINGVNKSLNSNTTASKSATTAVDEYRKKVAEMDRKIADSSLTRIQKLQEEKKEWEEMYKAVGKSSKAVEEYFDKLISAEKKSQRESSYSSLGSLESDIAQLTGTDTQGTELADKWISTLKKASEAYKNLPEDMKKELLGNSENDSRIDQAYTDFIMSEMFPKKKEIGRAKYKWLDMVKKELNDKTTNKELEDILIKLSSHVREEFAPEGYLNVFEQNGVFDGVGVNFEFRDQMIKDAKKKYIDIFKQLQEVLDKGGDEGTEQKLRDTLNAQVAIIQNLQEEKDLYEEIVKLANGISTTMLKKSANQIWTENFFGTKTDENGFAIDGEKMGKTLKNAAKVWQDYGKSVQTVLSAIGSAWQDNINAQVEAGRMTEEEAKKQFNLIKAMQYSMAVINSAASIISVWADPEMGVYAKIATTVALAAENAANLITIATTQFGDMGASTSAGATINPAVINDTNPVQYTRNYTTAEEQEQMNNIWVSVRDIDEAQDRRKAKVAESRF